MTPDINIMRDAVINMYPNSQRWRRRVAKMPDGQVMAIYMKRQQKLAEEANKPKKNEEPDLPF